MPQVFFPVVSACVMVCDHTLVFIWQIIKKREKTLLEMCMENKSPYNNLHIVKDDATVTKNQRSFTAIPKNDPSLFLTTHTTKTHRVATLIFRICVLNSWELIKKWIRINSISTFWK